MFRIAINRLYKKILNPFDNIYIANEAFSKHQCWIEGSLKMVKDVFHQPDEESRETDSTLDSSARSPTI